MSRDKMLRVPRRPARSLCRPGFSSTLATFYVVIFSALAIAFSALSNANTEVSANARRVNRAYAAAESGVSLMRYHISGLRFDGSAAADAIFLALGQSLADTFDGTLNLAGQHVAYSDTQINVPSIATDAAAPGSRFSAQITRDGDTFYLTVTGQYGDVVRAVRLDFAVQLGPVDRTLLDHGIASKGSLRFDGSATMRSNIVGGSAVMSTDPDSLRPIRVNGSGSFDGDFYMVKDGVTGDDVFSSSSSQFLSEDGSHYDTDVNAHTHAGVPEPAWPTVDTAPFATLIASLPHTTITSDTDVSDSSELHNLYIEAGANPTFKSGVVLKGLIYVEWPNNITFNGGSNITGLIVCQGPPYTPGVYEDATNRLRFNGAVNSSGVENLPDTYEYAGLRDQTGTFLLAPDYEVEFNGAMGTVNGSIYASELDLNGTTTGTIRGSILVDRRRQFTKLESVSLYFEKDPEANPPVGLVFEQTKVLRIVVGSYTEL